MTTLAKYARPASAWEQYAHGSLTAKDGVTIGYRVLGHGPGIILIHGAFSSGYNHKQLAEELSDICTVYVPDRRGRGLSGPYAQHYTIQDDVDDLEMLLAQTGAHAVFGVSSGALISLRAAQILPSIQKLAVFEPPFFINIPFPTDTVARFDRELSQGKIAAALVAAMKGSHMGPPVFDLMPRWLLEVMATMMLRGEEKNGSGEYIPVGALAPTLRYDNQIVAEMHEQMARCAAIHAQTLLLGGSNSPKFLKTALDALAAVLPTAQRVEIQKVGHAASWNVDRGGKPALVAQELRRFFGEAGS